MFSDIYDSYDERVAKINLNTSAGFDKPFSDGNYVYSHCIHDAFNMAIGSLAVLLWRNISKDGSWLHTCTDYGL